MSPAEVAGWRIHRMRYPPVEHILAALWLTVARALGNSEATAEDMGYWLETAEQRRARHAREARARRVSLAQLTADAYRRVRDDG